jgi:hypothetical protein
VKKTNFLPSFPTTLFGSPKRSLQEQISRERQKLSTAGLSDFSLLFASLLPASFLQKITFNKRKRVYTEMVVFWAWLAQVLMLNASCSKAVTMIRSWCADKNLPTPSAGNGAYCTARKRLRLEFLQTIFKHIVKTLNRRIRTEDRWKGLVVKSIDGSSVQLMDTEENQDVFPQPNTQKKGCGFPVMGVAAVLNHAHGGWEGFVSHLHTEHDHKVAHRLIKYFEKGDLALADSAYSSYELISRLLNKGVYSLMPLHQARKADFRKGKKIGPNERIYTWQKPKTQPKRSNLSEDEWLKLPKTMKVRVIRFWYDDKDGRQVRKHLVTTLIDQEKYAWEELVSLYLERWDIELRFRDVKTTMQFEELHVRTPEMAKKSLAMAVIGFNLIKAVSQEAAIEKGENIRHISVKGALDEIVSFSSNLRAHAQHRIKCATLYQKLTSLVGDHLLDIRPFRREPRTIKKRPKQYSRSMIPRSEWKARRVA